MDFSGGRLPPEYSNNLLYPSDLFIVLAVASWLFEQISHPNQEIFLNPILPTFALTILAGWATASLLWSLVPPLTAAFALRLWLLLGVYICVRHASLSTRRWIERFWIGMGLVQAIIGLGQFLLQHQVGLEWAGELVRDANVPGAIVVQAADQMWLRSAGLTSSPNALGTQLTVSLLLLTGRYLDNNHRSTISILVYLVGISLLCAGIVTTFSRTAWGGLTIGMGVLMLLAWQRSSSKLHRRRTLLLSGCLLVGMLIFLIIYGPLFEARLSGTLALISSRLSVPNLTEQANIAQRITYRRDALMLWRTSPWLGMGAGSSSLASLLMSNGGRIANPGPVHSVPLLLLVDLGPMGLAAWGMLILAVLKISWQSRHSLFEKPMQAAWTVASVVLLLMGCFDHHFLTYQQGRVALWLTLGAWAAGVE